MVAGRGAAAAMAALGALAADWAAAVGLALVVREAAQERERGAAAAAVAAAARDFHILGLDLL